MKDLFLNLQNQSNPGFFSFLLGIWMPWIKCFVPSYTTYPNICKYLLQIFLDPTCTSPVKIMNSLDVFPHLQYPSVKHLVLRFVLLLRVRVTIGSKAFGSHFYSSVLVTECFIYKADTAMALMIFTAETGALHQSDKLWESAIFLKWL